MVTSLNISVLKQLFPNIPPNLLVKESRKIDLLIGNDYHGLYPIHQIAKSGDHLSVMEGPFGLCVQGSHPALVNGASATRSVSAHAEVQCCQVILHNNGQLAKLDSVSCYETKAEKSATDNFILGEELGVEVQPQCRDKKRGKCPAESHANSSKEEQELQVIHRNLKCDADNRIHVFFSDQIAFQIGLNVVPKSEEGDTKPILIHEKFSENIPLELTKWMFRKQTINLYELICILCLLILHAKVLLRETWSLNLGWDETLAPGIRAKWVKFFQGLLDVHGKVFCRVVFSVEYFSRVDHSRYILLKTLLLVLARVIDIVKRGIG